MDDIRNDPQSIAPSTLVHRELIGIRKLYRNHIEQCWQGHVEKQGDVVLESDYSIGKDKPMANWDAWTEEGKKAFNILDYIFSSS